MVIKIYKGVGPGESLYKAIMEKGNGCYNPPMVDKWIEDQQEAYMEKDYDADRLYTVLWELKTVGIIRFLERIGVDVNNYELSWDQKRGNKYLQSFFNKEKVEEKYIPIDRDIFKIWMFIADDEEKEFLKQLQQAFINDLENDKNQWSYQRGSEDYDSYLGEVDEDNDEEVAVFFNIPLEVEGVVIEGTEVDLSEVEFCKSCGEAIITERMKADYAADYDDDNYDDTMFYCVLCNVCYKYDKEHGECNKHIPAELIIARRV